MPAKTMGFALADTVFNKNQKTVDDRLLDGEPPHPTISTPPSMLIACPVIGVESLLAK